MPNGVFRGRCFINAIWWLTLFTLEKWTTISDTTTSHTLLYYPRPLFFFLEIAVGTEKETKNAG
jgi:hypothetical protein